MNTKITDMQVDILLATYNGEKHLEAQLNSIVAQSYKDWRLLIHDDGSSDSTLEIVEIFTKKYPKKIFLVDDHVKAGGAKNNFFHLMRYVEARYVMFSDQDDYWEKYKVQKTVSKMLEEDKDGSPCLVYTDLKVVSSDLTTIAPSLKKYQQLRTPKNLNEALLCNCVTGCTMMINRPLIDVLSYPDYAIMHDWWFMIEVFKNDGKLIYIDEALILYRQHEANEVGAIKKDVLFYFFKILRIKRTIKNLKNQYMQYNSVLSISFSCFVFKKIKFLLLDN